MFKYIDYDNWLWRLLRQHQQNGGSLAELSDFSGAKLGRNPLNSNKQQQAERER